MIRHASFSPTIEFYLLFFCGNFCLEDYFYLFTTTETESYYMNVVTCLKPIPELPRHASLVLRAYLFLYQHTPESVHIVPKINCVWVRVSLSCISVAKHGSTMSYLMIISWTRILRYLQSSYMGARKYIITRGDWRSPDTESPPYTDRAVT